MLLAVGSVFTVCLQGLPRGDPEGTFMQSTRQGLPRIGVSNQDS